MATSTSSLGPISINYPAKVGEFGVKTTFSITLADGVTLDKKKDDCRCIYCIDYNKELARIDAEIADNTSEWCRDCFDYYLDEDFKWKTINEYIAHHHGEQYIPELNAKINAYIQALFSNTPLQIEKQQYFADNIALGCHVQGYINACFKHIKYLNGFIASKIVQAHMSKDTISQIARDFTWNTDNQDIFYECVRTGNIPYLREYTKTFKIDFTNTGLNYQIGKNPDMLSNDIITLLIDLAGRNIIDDIIIKGLTDTIERNMSDNAKCRPYIMKPPYEPMGSTDCSLNPLVSLDNLPTKLTRLSTTSLFQYDDTAQMNDEVKSVLEMLNQNAVYKVYRRYCRNIIGSIENLTNLITKFEEQSKKMNSCNHYSLEDINKHIPMMFNLIIEDIFNDCD
jgi:hypothetical protein